MRVLSLFVVPGDVIDVVGEGNAQVIPGRPQSDDLGRPSRMTPYWEPPHMALLPKVQLDGLQEESIFLKTRNVQASFWSSLFIVIINQQMKMFVLCKKK